jgi:hypothetical protein
MYSQTARIRKVVVRKKKSAVRPTDLRIEAMLRGTSRRVSAAATREKGQQTYKKRNVTIIQEVR